MPSRTSLTHPLHIDEVPLPSVLGRLSLTICPGKRGESVMGEDWARDLETDLGAIGTWGAGILGTLLEDHELDKLGVSMLPDRVKSLGLGWQHLSVRRFC